MRSHLPASRSASDDGYVIEHGPTGSALVVTGGWTDAAPAVMAAGVVDGLVLNYARGFRERGLDFLQAWPARSLTILARTIDDIEPVYRLAGTLEHLSLTTSGRAAIDCARTPKLRSIWVESWAQLSGSVSSAALLEDVGIYGFNETDLSALAHNDQLRSIRLKQAPRLESLHGIENLPLLDSLQVAGAHHLRDLTALREGVLRLRSLNLESCGGITMLDDLAPQTNLAFLAVANCGNIDSLRPIAPLSKVESLYLFESTRIVDGDLTPLLQLAHLRDLRIMNRRHYTPTVSEIGDQLGLATT